MRIIVNYSVDKAEFTERLRYLHDHPVEKSRDEISLVDGRVFDRYSTPMLGTDGEYYGRVWYFWDVTDDKRNEEALRHANDDLEKRVAVRTAELRESEERFLQLAENIHEAFYVVSIPERVNLYVSPAFETIWDISRDTLYKNPLVFFEQEVAMVSLDDDEAHTGQAEEVSQLHIPSV